MWAFGARPTIPSLRLSPTSQFGEPQMVQPKCAVQDARAQVCPWHLSFRPDEVPSAPKSTRGDEAYRQVHLNPETTSRKALNQFGATAMDLSYLQCNGQS